MPPPGQMPTRIEIIVERTATAHDVRVRDLLSRKRIRRFARPRMVAMVLARELTGRSHTEIGRAFGRDHSTVTNALATVARLCRQDVDFARAFDRLRQQLDMEINGAAAPADLHQRAADAARVACHAQLDLIFGRLRAAADRNPFGLLAALENVPCERL